MSRYQLDPFAGLDLDNPEGDDPARDPDDDPSVWVGWDPGLGTYFAQVQAPGAPEGELLLWVGTTPGELTDTAALWGAVEYWAEWDRDVFAALVDDRRPARPGTCTRYPVVCDDPALVGWVGFDDELGTLYARIGGPHGTPEVCVGGALFDGEVDTVDSLELLADHVEGLAVVPARVWAALEADMSGGDITGGGTSGGGRR